MGNWFKQPMLSALLLLAWLLLVDSFTSPGQWVFGAILALAIPRLMQNWWLPGPKIRSWSALVVFLWRALTDIVLGNIEVARLALGPQAKLEPKFVEFHTVLNNELAIFMLMSAISLAPGSVSTCYNRETKRVEVHALHCTDVDALRAGIRQRYEVLLQQVFI